MVKQPSLQGLRTDQAFMIGWLGMESPRVGADYPDGVWASGVYFGFRIRRNKRFNDAFKKRWKLPSYPSETAYTALFL